MYTQDDVLCIQKTRRCVYTVYTLRSTQHSGLVYTTGVVLYKHQRWVYTLRTMVLDSRLDVYTQHRRALSL